MTISDILKQIPIGEIGIMIRIIREERERIKNGNIGKRRRK